MKYFYRRNLRALIRTLQRLAMSSETELECRYEASMVLTGVGDAMGYKNGDWEFCFDGEKIHSELAAKGGIEKLHIKSEYELDMVGSLVTI